MTRTLPAMPPSGATDALALASLRRRCASLLYELLLMLGVVGGLAIPLILISAFANATVPIPTIRVYMFLGLAIYFLWHWHGGRQTLAMRTWKLRIVTVSGLPASMTQLVVRFLLAWPSYLLLGVGILWAFFDRDRQFLHDRIAGTRIIAVLPTTASPPPPTGT